MNYYFLQKAGSLLYPGSIWHGSRLKKTIYLTFDDGPHPSITNEVMNILNEYQAKATFFCTGKNLEKNDAVARAILQKGHLIANHTWSHPNGWKLKNDEYIEDVKKGKEISQSNLFRPPYGKITFSSYNSLKKEGVKTIFWDNLSCDYDQRISPHECFKKTLINSRNGSIIVFHDSEKAVKNMLYALPLLLKGLKEKGYRFDHLGTVIS